ncbi:MAG TPA: hypothetical protein ENI11_02335 [Actinobacteria bacterium]|nr:hypothetical protein [Actinomycetota bacterium]
MKVGAIKLAINLLEKGHAVNLKVRGTSMQPFLKHDERIVLLPIDDSKVISPGIIVAYSDRYGAIITHRVKRVFEYGNDTFVITRGDSKQRCDDPVKIAQIIGLVSLESDKDSSRCSGSFGSIISGTYVHFEDIVLTWCWPHFRKQIESKGTLYDKRAFMWDYFVNKIVWHGVGPMLYDMQKDNYQPLDKELFKFDLAGIANTRRVAQVQQQLKHYLELFAKSHINVLVVNGAAYAELLYDQPGLRPFGDIDLLVHSKDRSVLKDTIANSDIISLDNQNPKDDYSLDNKTEVQIDIHSVLGSTWNHEKGFWSPLFHGKLEAVFNEAISCELAGTKALVPSIPFQLLFACVRLHSHILMGSYRLIWLLDIVHICDRLTRQDWHRFKQLCKENEVEAQIGAVVTFAEKWMGSSIPSEILTNSSTEDPGLFEQRLFETL